MNLLQNIKEHLKEYIKEISQNQEEPMEWNWFTIFVLSLYIFLGSATALFAKHQATISSMWKATKTAFISWMMANLDGFLVATALASFIVLAVSIKNMENWGRDDE